MASSTDSDDMPAEYEFSKLKPLSRGVYAKHFNQSTLTTVVIDPDICEAFPTSEAVNEALRSLMQSDPDTPAS